MSYATVAELREYLPQIPASAGTDTQLQKILDRSTQMIDTELGFAFGAATVGTATIYGDGTDYLIPPIFVTGSVTAVSTLGSYTVPDYIEQDGALVVTRGSLMYRNESYGLSSPYDYGYTGGWLRGVPYTVSATYGWSSVPADIVECCLELAVRTWRARDAGFSDVVGVEGGGDVTYTKAYSATVKRVLDIYKSRSQRGLGVW